MIRLDSAAAVPGFADLDVAALSSACESELTEPSLWSASGGHAGLAPCILDAVYSTSARYSSAVDVVRRYRDNRLSRGGNPDVDGADALFADVAAAGGAVPWSVQVGDRSPIGAPGSPLRAEAVSVLCRSLLQFGARTTGDLRTAAEDPRDLKEIERAWRGVPGQRSGVTWTYLLVMARVAGITTDRMALRFVARAIGVRPQRLTTLRANYYIDRVALRKGCSSADLSLAMWRFESGVPARRLGW